MHGERIKIYFFHFFYMSLFFTFFLCFVGKQRQYHSLAVERLMISVTTATALLALKISKSLRRVLQTLCKSSNQHADDYVYVCAVLELLLTLCNLFNRGPAEFV